MSDDLSAHNGFYATGRRRLITVHSQKGGVGKTLISMYVAARLARELKEKTVLIDADLAGTSLTDVLRLKAPRSDGTLHTVLETIQLLKEMSGESTNRAQWLDSPPPGAKMLNHFLFCNPWIYQQALSPGSYGTGNSFELGDLLWIWEPYEVRSESRTPPPEYSCLRITPSSGFSRHLGAVLPHVYKEDLTGYLESRLADLVWALWTATWEEPFVNVIVDTPPVLGGMSKAVLRLHGSKEPKLPQSVPAANMGLTHLALFVTTPDAQDLLAYARGIDELALDGHLSFASKVKQGHPVEGLLFEELCLVINKVPDRTITIPSEGETRGPASQGAPADAGVSKKGGKTFTNKFNLGNPAEARRYCYECISEQYEFQSKDLTEGEVAKELFVGETQAPVVLLDEKCALQFLKGQAELSILKPLEPVFNAVANARPRNELYPRRNQAT